MNVFAICLFTMLLLLQLLMKDETKESSNKIFINAFSFTTIASHRLHLQNMTNKKPTFVLRASSSSSSSTMSRTCAANTLEMKVSKGKSKHSKGNTIQTNNRIRKRLAGRPGNKHFLDPNKLFIGNLAYDADEDDVKSFLQTNLGTLHYVDSVKIIRDWKTGISKGYGFVNFVEPMYATSAMEIVKNRKLKGRVVRLDQGKRKDSEDDRKLFVKKRMTGIYDGDEESMVIDNALDDAEKGIDFKDPQDEEFEVTLDDFDDDDDAMLFSDDEDDDDDEDEYDGIFEEIYGMSKREELDEEEAKDMNRSQRREAAKRKPRKKLPRKGFGV